MPNEKANNIFIKKRISLSRKFVVYSFVVGLLRIKRLRVTFIVKCLIHSYEKCQVLEQLFLLFMGRGELKDIIRISTFFNEN